MTTLLSLRKDLVRKVAAPDGTQLIVKITPAGIYTKLARQHWNRAVFFPWFVIYGEAATIAAAADDERKRQSMLMARGAHPHVRDDPRQTRIPGAA